MSDLKNDFETAIFIMERLVQHAGQCEARDKAFEFLIKHPIPGSYAAQAESTWTIVFRGNHGYVAELKTYTNTKDAGSTVARLMSENACPILVETWKAQGVVDALNATKKDPERSPEGYEYDEKNNLVHPAEIYHLRFTTLPVLWEMERKGGLIGELATKELKFRHATYSRLGQG